MAMLTKEEVILKVKTALNITDTSRDILIGDMWQSVVNYLNTDGLPEQLEHLVRSKVKGIIDYEAQVGTGQMLDVTSQTEGKCSWTFNVSAEGNRNAIYGFSTADFRELANFRKVRW